MKFGVKKKVTIAHVSD